MIIEVTFFIRFSAFLYQVSGIFNELLQWQDDQIIHVCGEGRRGSVRTQATER